MMRGIQKDVTALKGKEASERELQAQVLFLIVRFPSDFVLIHCLSRLDSSEGQEN